MRSTCLLLAAMLLYLSPVASLGAAPRKPATIPTFKQAKSWQITYSYGPAAKGQAPSAPLRISYLAPDRLLVRDADDGAFSAMSDGRSIRLYFPEMQVALWAPASSPIDLPQLAGLTLGGNRGPFAIHWKTIREALRRGGRDGNVTCALLPEEKVAGRKCLVLQMSVEAEDPTIVPNHWVFTQWFDAEYGLPLAQRGGPGEHPSEMRATSVRINPPLKTDQFALRLPPETRVFTGLLSCCDLYEASDALSEDSADADQPQPLPERAEATTVLLPTSAPAGFHGLSTSSDTSGLGRDAWSYSVSWFSKSGGAIKLYQGRGNPEERTVHVTGDTQEVTVRGKPAQLLTYHDPFEGLILTWQEGDAWFRLEGTGVTAADLTAMAEGMKEVKVTPTSKTEAKPQPSRRSAPGTQ